MNLHSALLSGDEPARLLQRCPSGAAHGRVVGNSAELRHDPEQDLFYLNAQDFVGTPPASLSPSMTEGGTKHGAHHLPGRATGQGGIRQRRHRRRPHGTEPR
ncbi:hypothetical protein KYG_14288 [Acidovorax sp. NO-1]|uniref:hypothetical protein n=1 Tax=Acidovorax sp. NO-1 TaxID=512030 RepID=UPI00023FC634|nr:hypothetical protein [Acidovorax sp. NO-1]EHL22160.1 hypothetical protein KYG_14288 [Acidovorax sp. NO-1]